MDSPAAAAGSGESPAQAAPAPPSNIVSFPFAEYSDAVEKESAYRDFAFVDVGAEICELRVRQLTLRMALTLGAIGNPFLAGGAAEAEDVTVFLWHISPDYVPEPQASHVPGRSLARRLADRILRRPAPVSPRAAFCRRVAWISYIEANKEIRAYLDLMFFDAPGGGSGRASFTSFVVSYIDMFGSEYGWSKDAVLDCPMPQLYQLAREALPRFAALARVNTAPINRLSDKVKSNYLRRLNRLPERP